MNKELTFDAIWDYIIEYGIATEDELILVCHINGRRIETLNDVIEVRTTYQDWEHYKSSLSSWNGEKWVDDDCAK